MTPLFIASGVEGKGTSSLGVHGIVVRLMGLDICPKFQLTVGFVANILTSDKDARTEGIRHPCGGWEAVEPKGAIVDKFNDHMGKELGKRKRVVNSTSMFLYGPNVTFHFWDMFAIGGSVECDLHVREVSSYCVRLAIHEYCRDGKAAMGIYCFYLLDHT